MVNNFFCWALLLIQNYVIYFLAINHGERIKKKEPKWKDMKLYETKNSKTSNFIPFFYTLENQYFGKYFLPLISSTEFLVRKIKTKINPSSGIDTKNIHCHFIPTSLILLTVKGRRVQRCPKAIGTKRKLKIVIVCAAIEKNVYQTLSIK